MNVFIDSPPALAPLTLTVGSDDLVGGSVAVEVLDAGARPDRGKLFFDTDSQNAFVNWGTDEEPNWAAISGDPVGSATAAQAAAEAASDPVGSAAAARVAAEAASDPAGAAAAAQAASDPVGSAAAAQATALAVLAGVVQRKSTKLGDSSSTITTDGVVSKTGAGSSMTFSASGGLFRLNDGTVFFHETHAWTPSAGDAAHDRIDTIWVAVGPGTDDSQSDPAGAGYEYNTGQPASSPNPAPPSDDWTAYVAIAQVLVPPNALHANDCTITDLRRFV